jgi:two-component system phosphate regulon sensor histidine kinase PhoR
MWSSRLFWKLVLIYGGLNLLLAITFPIALSRWEEDYVMSQVRIRLHSIALMTKRSVSAELSESRPAQPQPAQLQNADDMASTVAELAELCDVRITIVSPDGTVVAESGTDPEQMQNHGNREELAEAKENEIGDSVRRSSTLGIPFLYIAVPVRHDGVLVGYVRVAEQVQTIRDQARARQRQLWLYAVAIALSAAPITYLIAGRIVRPLSELRAKAQAIAAGDYDQSVRVTSRDEIGDLAVAFSKMGKVLSQQINQLKNQNQRMTTVLHSMVEGVLAVDSNRRVLLANDASAELLGVNLSNAIGRPLLEVARNADIDAAVREAESSNEPTTREINIPGSTRRTIQLLATQLPIEPTPGVVIVLHDVTELRRLEGMRRNFVANVSHELKTPLASIKAYAETLLMGAIDDPANNRKFVDRISEQAERLHELIVDMLTLARVESGKEAFQFVEVDVDTVAQDCLARYQPMADQKAIELRCEGDPQVIAWGDQDGVGTILNNLLGNAIKYTPESGTVVVRCRRDAEFAIIEVEDSGVGIDAKDHERVFERFFRVDKARNREQGGTGLGLAIVKHLAQAFGGSVELISKPNEGSTFRVRLHQRRPV